MENTENKKIYHASISNYNTSFEEYYNTTKKFGRFIENGSAYEITDKNTPRQWFNFLCNDKFVSVITNKGFGFTAYKALFVRVTKYYHFNDYLPRTLDGSRKIMLQDIDSGKEINVLQDADDLVCVHKPGLTMITAVIDGIEVKFSIFVPVEDPCECWNVTFKNISQTERRFKVRFEQTWSFMDVFTYGKDNCFPDSNLDITQDNNKIIACSSKNKLPTTLYGFFLSPQVQATNTYEEIEQIQDGREFKYTVCSLQANMVLLPDSLTEYDIISGAEEDEGLFKSYLKKYENSIEINQERVKTETQWANILAAPSCEIPDKNLQNFLNVWIKNQLFLTYRYTRADLAGYRDVVQDSWGYMLIDPYKAKERLLQAISHMFKDGRCPRQYDIFENLIDYRDFADSPTWIPMSLTAYIQETGDYDILYKKLPYLDDKTLYTVEEHIWNSLQYLNENKGENGLILMRGGDWLDSMEGMDKFGPATSVWLSMATFHAQNLMAKLYEKVGDVEKSKIMLNRSAELKKVINEVAWDGSWYIYAFTGSGAPVGSSKNNEGKIHLNAQTWAIFTGIADADKIVKMNKAIDKYLNTPVGPMLITPPYVYEAAELGRLGRQEPGVYGNGSIYMHGASFKIFADIASGNYDDAVDTFSRILPNNPDNSDCRRTSEPYCVGNAHLGVHHSRYGQNVFSWFTATQAWLLHAGFDELCGVKADYDGLVINPKVPTSWKNYKVKKKYRGAVYDFEFVRVDAVAKKGIWVDGMENLGNVIEPKNTKTVSVLVWF